MSNPGVRTVNVVPYTKIKVEMKEEDEDDSVSCQVCYKTFASQTALGNHARMEHFDVFSSGEKSMWMAPEPAKLQTPKAKKNVVMDKAAIKVKTEELISSMEPTNIMSLANEDVSYIIIKSEAPPVGTPVEKEKKRKPAKEEKEKVLLVEKKKEKEVQPITGPFECLQPSTLVASGLCHQIFFSCCEYSQHFRDEHTRRRKGLRCQVCEKPLAGSGEEPTTPYPCEVCGTGFQTNKELSDHMAIEHVKLKPYECEICHKRFTQLGGVQQHMRMHTGDRPFSCVFCPKAFTQKSGLDQHLRIHTKVKPYRCVVCSKTFCQSVHLKQHMRTHTNVSPFQCGICHKRFKQSSHLNYHLKNHNTASMTAAQREEYKKLVSVVSGRAGGRRVVLLPADNGQVIEVVVAGDKHMIEEGELVQDDQQTEQEMTEQEMNEQEMNEQEMNEQEMNEQDMLEQDMTEPEMTELYMEQEMREEELTEEVQEEEAEEEAETIISDDWHVEYIQE